MGQGSRWAILVYPPERVKQQLTARKKQMAGSKWDKSQNRPRIKMGQESKGATVV